MAAALLAGYACTGHAQGAAQTLSPCLPPAAWYALGPNGARPVPAQQIIAEMAQREVVLLGEHHGHPDHHRWQLQTLAALHVVRPDLVVGFEAFPRRVQAVLDRWVAGELGAREFLAQVDWKSIWGYPSELYLPLFQFARMNRVPMIALNVERSLTRAVAAKGWPALAPGEKEGVSTPAPPAAAYREYLLGVYRQHGGGAGATADDPAFHFFVEAQLTWDRAMAEALARPLKQHESRPPLAVGLAGAGHVRYGHGIAHQLRDLGVLRIGTLLPLEAAHACGELDARLADAVFVLPPSAGKDGRKR
jgi:uncharacterized iron-regulated protein